jgi:VanZ family protein
MGGRLPEFKRWLPVVFWMALIFAGSACRLSVEDCGRIIGPVVRWLFHGPSPEAFTTAILCARKSAHVVEYAILAALLCRALAPAPWPLGARPRLWPKGGVVLALALLYAASDEFHQLFVPTRVGCVADVLIDASGAALGIAGFYAASVLCRRGLRQTAVPAGPRSPAT